MLACGSVSPRREGAAFTVKATIPFVFIDFWIDHDNVVTNHVIGVSGELAIEASALPNSQDCSGLRGSRKGLSRGSGCPLDRNLRFCPAIDGPSSREEPSDGGTMRARRTAHRGHLD